MASLADYFTNRDKNTKPKWIYGDRVFGWVGKIPVIGMVIREDYEDPKQVLCHLDLPIRIKGECRWIVTVPSKGMKLLGVL